MGKFGTIRVKLNELVDGSEMSRTKLCQRAEMQPRQLNRYYFNTVTRLDTDVLARLCTALECEIGDLLEFVPPEPEAEEKIPDSGIDKV